MVKFINVKHFNVKHFLETLLDLGLDLNLAELKEVFTEIEQRAMNGFKFIFIKDNFVSFSTYFDYDTKKYSNLEDAIAQKDYVLEVTL